MDDRERQTALLDHFWDHLDRDLAAAPPDDLDPATADLTRQLVSTLRPPAPESAFTAHLRQRLVAEATTARSPANDLTLDGVLPSTPIRPVAQPTSRTGWQVLAGGANRLAAAAVIIGLILATVLLLRGLPQRGTLLQPTAAPSPTADASAPPRPTAQAVATPGITPDTPGTWHAVGAMSVERSGHTATLLNDGRVLVVGGNDTGGRTLSAEIFDPATGSWSPAAQLFDFTRTGHTATLLPNGRVLIAGGGVRGSSLRSTQMYDPATNTWAFAASMADDRSGHLAVTLRDGTVLVLGGNQEAKSFAERYDPVADSWTRVGTFTEPIRTGIAATLLPNGQVLVVGGIIDGNPPQYQRTAERFDPTTNRWLPAAPMLTPRANPALVALPTGRVLAIGGQDGNQILASVEQYDPTTDTWTMVAAMDTPRAEPVATVLADGQVLVTGGHYYGAGGDPKRAEFYTPATDTWTRSGQDTTIRHHHTATRLRDGRVLIAGGEQLSGNSGQWFSSAEVYTPGAATVSRPAATPVASPVIATGDRVIAAPFLWITEGQRPDYRPQLSPDERRIAYFLKATASGATRLMIHDLVTDRTQEIANLQGALQASVRWSPDGQRLAYARVIGTGKQSTATELMIAENDLSNPRAIFRFDDPQAVGGPSFMVDEWSADGQRIRLGGTIFGSFREARWVGMDGVTSTGPALPAVTCGVDGRAVVMTALAADGRSAACITGALDPADRPASVPAGGLALVRIDLVTGQSRVLGPVPNETKSLSMSPDGAWIIVGTVEQMAGTSPGFEQRLRLSIIRSDGIGGLRPFSGDPYAPVQFNDPALTWTADGRAYFLARPVNGANHSWGYLYELRATSATMRVVTRNWGANAVLGTTRDGRQVLVARGDPVNPELALITVTPGGAPTAPVPTPVAGPVPDKAIETARGLMDARIARNEAEVRSYLALDLIARLATTDLLPPDDQRWTDYRLVAVVRDGTVQVQVAVQIYAPASFLEQIITLEERDGRWLVVALGPIESVR